MSIPRGASNLAGAKVNERDFPVRSLPIDFLVTTLIITGCHGNQNQNAANANPASPDQSQSQDPTSANIVPISNTSAASAPQDSSAAIATKVHRPQVPISNMTMIPAMANRWRIQRPEPPPPLPNIRSARLPRRRLPLDPWLLGLRVGWLLLGAWRLG